VKPLRDPERDKALSYARDRRNDYGENDKSSRRNIRRKKRRPHRADRRAARQALSGAENTVVPGLAEDAEERLRRRRPKYAGGRLKWADAALGDWVEQRLRRRAELGVDDAATTERRLDAVRRTRSRGGRS